MRTLIVTVCATVLALTAAPVGAAPDVTEVVVHGRKLDWSPYAHLESRVPGPMMWKLTRSGGTVWVIGVLEEAPQALRWDDRFLKHTLAGAKTLITPGTATFSREGEARYRQASVLSGVELSATVSAAAYDRLKAAVTREDGLRLDAYTHFTADRAGAELYDNVLARHGIAADIPQVSQIIALTRGTAIEVRPALHFDGDRTTDQWLKLDAAAREACLTSYLDGIDYDLDTLPRVAEAWAQGDMTDVGLFYRDTPSLTCDLLTPGWQATVETAALARMTQAIDDALRTPGQSVAVMRIGQLLRKGGILDQLHDRGVEIAPAA
jgi:hypothetical protein